MHRSARSDLFFEGVVAEKCAQSNMCHILFSEGRARGLKERVPLKDINEISRAKIDVGQLSGWCSNKKPARITLEEDELIDCKVGEFVLIEGPEDSTWAAQLLEPYSGKVRATLIHAFFKYPAPPAILLRFNKTFFALH